MSNQAGKWREDQVLIICPGSKTTMAQLGCSELTPPAHRFPTRMFKDDESGDWRPYHTFKRKKKATSSGTDTNAAAVPAAVPAPASSTAENDEWEWVEDTDSEEGAVYPMQGGRIVNMEAFLAFLDHIHSILTTTYHNTPIMLMASPQWTRPDTETITRYIFEKTRTPALCLIHSGIATQYGLKWANMTVVDIGYEKVDVTCIYEGRVVNHRALGSPLLEHDISGGEVFTRKLLELLKGKNFTYDMAEQLKKSPICEVLPYAPDHPQFMELPTESTATAAAGPAAEAPATTDPSKLAATDGDEADVLPGADADGVLDVATIVTSGNAREFLAKKEKEKAEKTKGRKGKGQEADAARPGRLPNSKRMRNVFQYEEVIQEEVPLVDTTGAVGTAGENKEGENKEGENKEGENKEGENKEGENKEGENKEGEAKEGEAKDGEVKEGQTNEGENKEGDAKEGEPKVGENNDDQTKADETKADETKDGQPKEDGNKEGENKEGENKEGENKEGENKEGENKEGENKEGENKEGEAKEGESKDVEMTDVSNPAETAPPEASGEKPTTTESAAASTTEQAAKPTENQAGSGAAANEAAASQQTVTQNRRTRREIEVGLERFTFAERAEIDRIVWTVYSTIQGIDEMYMRPACWDNLVFVGNGSRLRGLKENIMQTLNARHLISPSTATMFTSELPSNLATPTGTGSQTPTGSVTGTPYQLPTGASSSGVNPLLQAATTASSLGAGAGGASTPGPPGSTVGEAGGQHTSHFHSQTPTSIKLAALPTYLSEWNKHGFEEAMFLGAQVAGRLAFCVHNLDMAGLEAQKLMSLSRVEYNELGPKGVRTHSMLQ
ncbi:hypothetical protein ACRALDRAFT_1076250 [Sodiomyces alcalophilus JCM 7366]|uniref:uncharacterized protein n=1 Tax=Sodiomyces alcalophilus JCM 7366 TaxID=591952 RepID=UPI0039B527E2